MKRPLTELAGTKRPSRNASDEFVASILEFLAADKERLSRFLTVTGLAVADLRSAAATSGFAESLLDYLCSDEALLLAYAADSGLDPADVEAMRLSMAPAPFDS